ncbi:HAD-IIB family hydrolase [Pectinatus brassicae]|uniref:Uncharacterized protein n=1 Tax=Pectinatus brassicae TaxID=862415 RepID=A0A840UDX9_9FIRM|nr:HAD-IIB family hydrolase [Pectinatus brassicae]MBB5335229.1 hypothetical protein [Pectinatus brassicae]
MKIAASDFDGTLYFPPDHFPGKNGIAEADVMAVSKWRQAGNIFGIVTGRNYQGLLRDSNRYGMEFDFAICLTGAVIYDEEMRPLEQNPIDNIVSREILLLPLLLESRHIACFTAYETYVCIQSDESWFKSMINPSKYTEIDFFMAECLKGICQISLQYSDKKKAAEITAQINKMAIGVSAYQNMTAIDIVKDDTNKFVGLNKLLQMNNWHKNEIITIGDGDNDLPMITKLNGFTVESASDNVKCAATRVYKNVAALLNDKY